MKKEDLDHVKQGRFFGRIYHAWRSIVAMRVPVYAGNASFFIVLAVFPGLLLLLSLLKFTNLDVGRLAETFEGVFPQALLSWAETLILNTYDHISGTLVGFTALTTLWSASRGTYGFIVGLNGIYGVTENRGYFMTRCISVLYTFAFVIVMILTLALHVFGTALLSLLSRISLPVFQFLLDHINMRFFLLLFLQTGLFTAMFMALPNRKNSFWESVPGALLSSCGWLIFSDLYSIYVERFATLSNIYGSIYTLALSMLWLYFCISIVFYGGALNAYLKSCGDAENSQEEPEGD